MANTVKSQTKELVKEVSPENFNITVENILFEFSDYPIIRRLLEICGDKDLQFDLSPYGYEEYNVSRRSYEGDEGYNAAERLKSLKKADAILKARDSGLLNFKTTNGLFSAVAEKNDSGEILLRIFENREGKQMASALIGKLTILEDESYEPQTVILKYLGEFVGKPSKFYESIEKLDRHGRVVQLDFHSYVANNQPQEFLNIFLVQDDSVTISPETLSFDSRDLVRGMSIGFHPERIEAIVEKESPIGNARKKK